MTAEMVSSIVQIGILAGYVRENCKGFAVSQAQGRTFEGVSKLRYKLL